VHMVLLQAIKAYASAETAKENPQSRNSSLFLRRAECNVITDHFAAAIADYKTAAALLARNRDGLTAGGVTASDATERMATVVRFVRSVSASIKSRNHMKESKVMKIAKELPDPKELVANRTVVLIDALSAGDNKGKGVVLHVLCELSRQTLHSHAHSFFPAAVKSAVDQHVTPLYGRNTRACMRATANVCDGAE
jgi:hypothetical protein